MNRKPKRDMVRRPTPSPAVRKLTDTAFDVVRRECQGTGPRNPHKRAGRRPQ